jgi:hypothetical protein
MKSEVLTAVKMSLLVFWVVTPCGLAGRYQRFEGSYSLKMETMCSSETLVSTESTRRYNPEDKHRQVYCVLFLHISSTGLQLTIMTYRAVLL